MREPARGERRFCPDTDASTKPLFPGSNPGAASILSTTYDRALFEKQHLARLGKRPCPGAAAHTAGLHLIDFVHEDGTICIDGITIPGPPELPIAVEEQTWGKTKDMYGK